ncbi:MAG: hypothetical protein CBD31_04315 [Flavobacteriaceae bacterium TMED171]|nr:hypothetical protein [Flavobacteriaceae bacterium]OUW31467.1 MAG: hypothetical protein CBD31_04315 [Flavobacteriaceae bacterium TMED171]|tara:strand:- start:4443 stop:4862 length:420 start_codon:yes stop_codon:yes gene_type:complete
MIQKACELYERKDVLINNNWACQRRLSAETDFKFFEKLLDINFLSTVSMSRSILPLFKKQEGGQFDIVISVLRKFSSPFKLVYAASKHVLHGFIDSMRMEHYKDNIAAILIFLGFVCTPIAMNSLQRKWQSSSIGRHGD